MGRFNKSSVHKSLKDKEENLLAHLLLKKYGWNQLYLYIQDICTVWRTIIPISIGLTRYDAKNVCIYKFN